MVSKVCEERNHSFNENSKTIISDNFFFSCADIDNVMSKMTRPSEHERPMRAYEEYENWKAEDFRQFLLLGVGSICSQRRFLPDSNLYNVLWSLSNTVSAMMNPRQTSAQIDKARSHLVQFVDFYTKRLGMGWCTWKFHIFQHFIQLLLKHGSALFWDGFFREDIVGILKLGLTTKRNHDEQAVTNFLLSHHTHPYREKCEKSDRMKAFRTSCKRRTATGLSPVAVKVIDKADEEVFDEEKDDVLSSCGSFVSSWDVPVTRVLRCRRNGVVLTSKLFKHRGLVNDSFVYLDESNFGQIADIFRVGEESGQNDKIVVKLQMFEKVHLKTGDQEIIFPVFQFPVKETENFTYKLVTRSVVIQKACVGLYDHYDGDKSAEQFKFFCARPEVA